MLGRGPDRAGSGGRGRFVGGSRAGGRFFSDRGCGRVGLGRRGGAWVRVAPGRWSTEIMGSSRFFNKTYGRWVRFSRGWAGGDGARGWPLLGGRRVVARGGRILLGCEGRCVPGVWGVACFV